MERNIMRRETPSVAFKTKDCDERGNSILFKTKENMMSKRC